MPIDPAELARRARGIREPQPPVRRNPVRPEAGGGGGTSVEWGVIRSLDVEAGEMMFQRITYSDPTEPIPGEVEAYGETIRVYPPPTYAYDMFASMVYTEETDATDPIGLRAWPVMLMSIGGVKCVMPSQKFLAAAEFFDQEAPLSPAS
jgi:hypothetical protein